MKVIFHEEFYKVYTSDPAAESGRMEAIVEVLKDRHEFIEAIPATEEEIAVVHTERHIGAVKKRGLFEISSLAAGAAIMSARIGLTEPCFALIRPPGHHASKDSSWGFCYFNNMAVALTVIKNEGHIQSAFILDIDLHYGDGNVNILGESGWVRILNPNARTRDEFKRNIATTMAGLKTDIIGISAGFDNHINDWGGLLTTDDFESTGALAASTAKNAGAGYFAILEGGYNHSVLGRNVEALLKGMQF